MFIEFTFNTTKSNEILTHFEICVFAVHLEHLVHLGSKIGDRENNKGSSLTCKPRAQRLADKKANISITGQSKRQHKNTMYNKKSLLL